MSEQSPKQSSVDVFVEWAKARLDEMAADAKVLESRLDKFTTSLTRTLPALSSPLSTMLAFRPEPDLGTRSAERPLGAMRPLEGA
jgi:hypothetical protein